MRKKLTILLTIGILNSCCDCPDEKYNPSGFDPSSMSEKELYLTYGLEAPDELYVELQEQMEKDGFGIEKYCTQIENENPLSELVSVDIKVDSIKIISSSVTRSDYSNKVNKLVERLLLFLDWNYETEGTQSGDFNF